MTNTKSRVFTIDENTIDDLDGALVARTLWVSSINESAFDALRSSSTFDRDFVNSTRIQAGIERAINKPFRSTKELLDFALSVVVKREVVPGDTITYLGKVHILRARITAAIDCSIRVRCRKWGSVEVKVQSLEPIDGDWLVCLLFRGTIDQMVETLNAAKESPAFSLCLDI